MLKNIFQKSLHPYTFILVTYLLLGSESLFSQSGVDSTKIWVGTWSTAQQLVEPGNVPPSPGLTNNSLRQVVRVSIGGDTLQVKFSNEYSTNTVTVKSVQIAVSSGGSSIYDSTNIELKFNGSPEITMGPGVTITSDPIAFDLAPRMDVAITLYYGETSADITGHPGSRTTSYLLAGNDTSVTDFTGAITTDHWYTINGIDVLAPPTTTCIAIIGNSITDGRGTTTNLQNRWTDILSERLIANPGTQQVGVLNMGLGGNCVLKFCLGPSGVSRFENDILNQNGVRSAIVFEGVNDIGGVKTIDDVATIANDLIAAYQQMIDAAHARNIMIYGATIMAFKGNGYYNKYSEACRNKVNEWIRNSGRFDAVIDFDLITRSSQDYSKLGIDTYQNDGLHPTPEGYKTMGDFINLQLFEGLDSIYPSIDTSGIESLWIEPECSTVGENWKLTINPQASNEGYTTVKSGLNSISEAPVDTKSVIQIPFLVTYDTTYQIYARLNCPGTDDDSYWLKMDDGEFVISDGLNTSGWEWKSLSSYLLTPGEHNLIIAYREDGANLDKLNISNDMNAPTGIGKSANKVCLPDTVTPIVGVQSTKANNGYTLENYPNPFIENTTFTFEIPINTYVSLKVHNLLGEEIAELAGEIIASGKHTVKFNATNLSNGIYVYTIQADKFFATGKIILKGN